MLRVLASLCVLGAVLCAQEAGHPAELGQVAWLRDFEAGSKRAAAEDKPLLLLFQEVPGCQTCVDFGEQALSHPLLVEVIETAFVPVAIHNNKPGADDAVRLRFEEPAWNYPVARFLEADGKEIVARRDGIWTAEGFAQRLIEVLEAAERPVPDALRWAAAETQAGSTATLAMACFWSGEAQLGGLEGVLETQVGWLEGQEVVELRFDPEQLSYQSLLAEAQKLRCARCVFARDDAQLEQARGALHQGVVRSDAPIGAAQSSDAKFSLRRSAFRYLPLTGFQASKCNAALAAHQPVESWLSPRQQALQARIAAALAADAAALDGLQPPWDWRLSAEYTAKLEARLE